MDIYGSNGRKTSISSNTLHLYGCNRSKLCLQSLWKEIGASAKLRGSYIFLFFLLLAVTVSPVLATDPDVNLLDFPSALGARLGIDAFAGGILASFLVGFIVMIFSTLLRARGIVLTVILFFYMGFCVAIQWLPYWLMLGAVLLIAVLYADKIRRGL